MPGDAISILCTGDVHLGRHPTRIPSDLDGERFSPSAVWQATIDTAVRRDVDLVALTGDVVDRENRYFEAYGDVENGIEQLDAAGIPTVAVAGNHDYDVFPRLVDEIDADALHLLGADGEWERKRLALGDGRRVCVDGWSFPTPSVSGSPLESYDLPETDEPTIGLLHADLDARASNYAPVERGSLVETRVDGWLLGHIHRPRAYDDSDPIILYPGSLQPLDPGERGGHGPWLVTVDDRGTVDCEQLLLSTLRYDRLEVDAAGASDPKAVPSLVTDELESRYGDAPTGALELLLARVRLTGRTDAHAEITAARSDIADTELSVDGATVHLESIDVDTRPAVDLEDRAKGDNPVAYLADLLLTLEAGREDEFEDVIDDALGAMREAHQSNTYRELRTEDAVDRPTRADAAAAVEDQARLLLDELVAQREETA